MPDVHVKVVGSRVLLTGTLKNQYERNYAVQTARLFVGGGSQSSLSVGSNVDMKLETSSSKYNSNEDLEVSKTEDKGNIIDLLKVLHPTQIKLEAQIIEVNSDSAKDLGIQYGENGSGSVFTFGESHDRTTDKETYTYYDEEERRWRTYTIETNSNVVAFKNNPAKWIQQRFGPINATIHALVSNGKARVLSRPNITTMSGEQATIQIGGEIPYTSYDENNRPSVKFRDYGIILQFKPIVD